MVRAQSRLGNLDDDLPDSLPADEVLLRLLHDLPEVLSGRLERRLTLRAEDGVGTCKSMYPSLWRRVGKHRNEDAYLFPEPSPEAGELPDDLLDLLV